MALAVHPSAPLRLDTSLRFLKGVGPARAERLAAAGLSTVEDLLFTLPFRYEDRRQVVRVAAINAPGAWTVSGRIEEVRAIRTRRRGLVIVRARLVDETGSLPVSWFNQPYLAERLQAGGTWLLHGQARGADWGLWEMTNPTCEVAAGPEQAGRVVAIYPRVAGVSPANLGRLMDQALAVLETPEASEFLPPMLLRRYALPELPEALRRLHRPAQDADVEALNLSDSGAHHRIVYGELLDFQLLLAQRRAMESALEKRHAYRIDDRARAAARAILPFALTGAQKRVLKEIVEDLRSTRPMLRLLQGDVGSGKTIVAAICLLLAAESGLQAAFMAPTELLAEQHFASLRRLLGDRCRIELVSATGTTAAVRRAVADGSVSIAVGTHALIQRAIRFDRLGLAIIDEQHRFGVEQRKNLQSKGDQPDILVMTATPIPRTLTLTLYGDLDVSQIDEMPPGRGSLTTEVVTGADRREVYRRLRAELASGAQAYVVFPLIEESAEIDAASLGDLGDKVRTYLAEFPSAVLHGRVPAVERERIMLDFAAGKVKVLIATTVIEVGVDVPNATWMIIESAERFGLAQLHQLRGRVGRGTGASRCIAIHGRLSEEGTRRLEVFASTRDGFAIAEADLAIRGPGDLLGTRQAGLPRFHVANLGTHLAWIERARQDAREVVGRLGEPEFSRLRQRIATRAAHLGDHLAGG
ncbi:MAG: ATP-dependent DNA helicase RecG [Thermoanaerobaculia bacterium]